jgi:OOP family OmpA-OmpF porin
MKNFLIAFAVFVVWSFFGLWLYSWLKPTNEISSLKLNQSENIVEDTSITKIDDVVIPEIDVKNEIIPAQDSLLSFENIEKEDTRVTSVNGLKAINQQGDVIFLFPEAMSFIKNDNEVHIPASAIDFKYKINTYLLEHPDKEIQITSIYSPKENAESPNLGIKRGNKIKEILLETGIPSEKIVVKPLIK